MSSPLRRAALAGAALLLLRVDPPGGVIVNWNNKPPRGFEAADNQWSYGLSHRVDLLSRGLAGRRRHALTTVVGATNAAATQDLRAIHVVPALAAALRGAAPPPPRAGQMLALLRSWRNRGASRLDRDGDGRIDDPGAAIMDATWPRTADAVMGAVLGPQLAELATLEPRFEQPPGGQAAGNEPAAAPGANPAAWRADAKERISFVPGLLRTTLRHANRASGIQQVISFPAHRTAG